MPSETLLLTNGCFWTANPSQPWAEWVLISNGRITAIGSGLPSLESLPLLTKVLDLQGKLALPGLWDAHIHFYHWSLGLNNITFAECRSLPEMLESIARHVAHERSDDWIVGWGWNENDWPDSTLPTRADLDKLTGSKRPALFYRADMHSAVANSEALRLSGLLQPGASVDNGVVETDLSGEPTGIVRELAVNRVSDAIPAPLTQRIDQAFLEGQSRLHSLGITGICDQRMKDQSDGPRALASFARLNQEEELKLRVNCNIAAHQLPMVEGLGLQPGSGDDRLRIGHIKIFADGTLGSRTALMLYPFADEPSNRGMLITPQEQIRQEIHWAARLGFPVSIHAIGDQANRLCLDFFQELQESGVSRPAIPHRLEHVQVLDDDDLHRLANLGITASMQPGHILDDIDTADLCLGTRARLAYRLRGLQEQNTLLAFGSDAPVSRVDPLYGIHGAVTRQRAHQMELGPWQALEALTLEETLRGYTLGAAQAAGWDSVTGSLEVGKYADLCVLKENLFELERVGFSAHKILENRVDTTFFQGKIVYEREILSKQP